MFRDAAASVRPDRGRGPSPLLPPRWMRLPRVDRVIRSHRLLRELTDKRRRRRASLGRYTDPVASLRPLRPYLRALERDGLLDLAPLDGFDDRVLSAILWILDDGDVVRRVATDLSDRVFGDRVYERSLSRTLGRGAHAAALAAAEERILLAATYAMRMLADRIFEAEPVLPSEAATARAFAEGLVPRCYARLRDERLLHRYHQLRKQHPDWSMAEVSDHLEAGLGPVSASPASPSTVGASTLEDADAGDAASTLVG